VTVGTSNVQQNISVPVDASSCTAPGYAFAYDGAIEEFTGWTGTTTQDGWTQVDNLGNGEVWSFDNPGNRTPPPGSDGDFAIEDSDHYGPGENQDASLVSPVVDLSSQTDPEIGFDTDYNGFFVDQFGDVDLSVDGGATWTTVWEQTDADVLGHVDIPIPDAAGQADVQVRFHFASAFGWWWSLDNVFIGTRTCDANGGGLVEGIVRDNNTNAPLNGAKVTSVENPDEFGTTAATPDDPALPDGFYWLYSSLTGRHQFTASDGKYKPATANVNVAAGFVTQKNWRLKAGHLTVTPGSISKTMRLGLSKSATLTFGNDGTEPVHVKLGEQAGGFDPMVKGAGAPLQKIKGTFTTKAMVLQVKKGAHSGAHRSNQPALRTPRPYAPPWTDIADYPNPVMDNAVATVDGIVYSIAGFNGLENVADGFKYDPSAQAWSAIADAPEALESPAAAVVNGTIYVVGGWDADGNASNRVYAYDPAGDSWTQVADLPTSVSATSAASLNGQLYVVGGCTTGNCAPTSDSVYSYDPGSDSWTQLADYPSPSAFTACAGIVGELVCAGGVNADNNASSQATYVYDPGSDSWTQGADMPYDDWAMVYAGANDKLQIAGGVTDDSATVTNQAAEYDPGADSWAALPNANNAEYRGGGSCGIYKIGGSTGGFSPQAFSEVLPGYDQCGGGADVTWLSEDPTEFDVAPGATVTVTVTLDSSAVDQPGTYHAKLAVSTDTPYSVRPTDVTMHVNPPASWGKIRGTVTDATNGNPLAGATVQICTMYDTRTGQCGPVTYTLKTDNAGYYQLWLNNGFNPLEVIAAKDGYQPLLKIVRITAGGTTTANFALNKAGR
jgi:N-acetylneuraminic acid mutarotase